MRDSWLDEYTGDETVAHPDFRTRLRDDLTHDLAEPVAHRLPWKVIGWTAAAVAVLAGTVVVLSNDAADRRVVPAASTSSPIVTGSPPTITPTTVGGGTLRDRLVDVEWTVVTVDGVEVTASRLPTFILQSDGRLVGFDGCNQYGFDLSLPGGWTLTGDTLGLDQQIVSTFMSCTDIPNPVIPVADGTRLKLDAAGVLILTNPSGRVYTAFATANGAGEPANELVVPAEGGPLLAPTVVATVGLPTDEGAPIVALLPGRIVVLPLAPFRFIGSVLSFDRTGNPLPDTQLSPVPDGSAYLALGGLDGTLYTVTNSLTEDVQTVAAYQLDGDVWREVDSTVVEQNNDGVYAVTGEGLVLGNSAVLPAPTPDPTAPETGWIAVEDGMQVFRNDTDGTSTSTRWSIVEQFENFSIPPATNPFGDGVLFVGNASGADEQRYIGVLRPGGGSEFFRPDGWMLGGVDTDAALFVKAADGVVTIGLLGGAPQIDWASGTVLHFPIGFSGIDKVLTGVNPVFGEPTADSGWFTVEPIAPGDEDCLAGIEMRVLHWGDLAIAFRKMKTPEGLEGEFLWSWVVGDLRSSGYDSFREPTAAPAGPATGLRTEDGFGVGTSLAELQGRGEVTLSDFVNSDGSRSGTFVPAAGTSGGSFRGVIVDADGIVIGYGTTQAFC